MNLEHMADRIAAVIREENPDNRLLDWNDLYEFCRLAVPTPGFGHRDKITRLALMVEKRLPREMLADVTQSIPAA